MTDKPIPKEKMKLIEYAENGQHPMLVRQY